MTNKQKGVVSFSEDPEIPDGPPVPESDYQRQLGSRRYQTPTAGGEVPSIPILNDPRIAEMAQGGARMTPAQAADRLQPKSAKPPIAPPQTPLPLPGSPGSIFGKAPARAQVPAPPPQIQPQRPAAIQLSDYDIRPGDMLPDQAKNDPAYIQGQGSFFAVAQPVLALKYGVIRSEMWIAPAQLHRNNDGKVRLSDNTRQGLQAALEYTEMQNTTAAGNAAPSIPEPARQAPMQDVAKIAEPLRKLTDEERDEANKRIEQLDSFDHNKLMEAVRETELNSPEQRRIVEARLAPLSLEQMIQYNYVEQDVPIKPGTFVIRFRSVDSEVDLELKRIIMLESNKAEISERYYYDKYSYLALAASVVSINNNHMGSVIDSNGNFSEALLMQKYKSFIKFNLWMNVSMCVHFSWFDARVKRLFVAEEVKNG